MSHYDFDIAVIGAGPGGYVAAIRAAQLGLKAAVIEKGSLGGVCLNIGCIPTKSIIHQAEVFRGRSKLAAMGAAVDVSGFRYESVFDASRKAVGTLSKGVAYLLRNNGVEVISGTARLASEHEVSVSGPGGDIRKVTAGAVIAATGSRPKPLPGLPFDGEKILSSDDALMLKELPRRALIVGAGAIGVEFAHIFNAFGTETHLVETERNILPLEDGEITAVLEKSFAKRGIKIYTSSTVSSYNMESGGITVKIETAGKYPDTSSPRAPGDMGESEITETTVDKIFVMTGRAPNTEGIGLEDLNIDLTKGFVNVGDYYQTNVKSVYAIGDIVWQSPQLAHAASKAGEIAAEHIAGKPPARAYVDPDEVPSVVFCDPQAASFGPTDLQASSSGISFRKETFPFRGCGKAVAEGNAEGMVKILQDPVTGKIISAHIVGPGAAELIHELLLARVADITSDKIANMIHAHPTLSEAVMEAARALQG